MNARRWLIVALLGWVAAVAAAEPVADTGYMGDLVFAAKQRGATLPDFYRINPALDDDALYAVQRHYVARQIADGDSIAGFKSGFVPRAGVGGVVLARGLLPPGSPIAVNRFQRLIVEAEIAFRFCAPVQAPLADVAALKAVVCELAPAFEIADGALPDFAALRSDFTHLRAALIPLNIAYTHLLVGAAVNAADVRVDDLAVTIHHNGTEIGRRAAGIDLWANVLWAVNHFVLARGYTLAPGQLVIPGNLTGIHAGKAGHYEADYGALGTLRLEVAP